MYWLGAWVHVGGAMGLVRVPLPSRFVFFHSYAIYATLALYSSTSRIG